MKDDEFERIMQKIFSTNLQDRTKEWEIETKLMLACSGIGVFDVRGKATVGVREKIELNAVHVWMPSGPHWIVPGHQIDLMTQILTESNQ